MRRGKAGELDEILGLLRESYELDPGSIEYLIETSISAHRDGPVLVACEMLKVDPTDAQRSNLSQFIRRSLELDESIRRAFMRSVKKRGRCPVRSRAWLRSHLAPRQELPIRRAPQPLSGKRSRTHRMDLSAASGSLGDFPRLLDLFGYISSHVGHLQIKLGEFTYASALAVLAQTILSRRIVHAFEIDCPPAMQDYLTNVGFFEALENPEIIISPNPMDWAVGLTRINQDQPTERVTEKIVDILQTFVNPSEKDSEALLVLISEMIENVHRHSNSTVDGFAVAQVYPRKLKMGITLVDAGIGVRGSFEAGTPSIDVSQLTSDSEFLVEAINLYSTSKNEGHSGYGLYLLSQLIRRNRGTFLLSSGGASIIGYERGRELQIDVNRHRPWHGTIVSVIIDLSEKLPLSDIYDSLPTEEGEDHDLFVD